MNIQALEQQKGPHDILITNEKYFEDRFMQQAFYSAWIENLENVWTLLNHTAGSTTTWDHVHH